MPIIVSLFLLVLNIGMTYKFATSVIMTNRKKNDDRFQKVKFE